MHKYDYKIISLRNKHNLSTGEITLICLLFLIIPPILGLPFILYWISITKKHTNNGYFCFFICIAIYFAAINATKMPGGDQWQYWAAYMNVPKVGFIKSLTYIYGLDLDKEAKGISGEFMNGVYNYIGYYITFGYYPLYAALLTFANYILVFLGLYKFTQTLKKPHIPIVCGVLILSFFIYIFNTYFKSKNNFSLSPS